LLYLAHKTKVETIQMSLDNQKSEEEKKIKDDLHALIQSMNNAEKGYFTKYAQRHTLGEKNNYLILFNLLSEMQDYDAAELAKRLHAQGATSNILAVKNQLKGIIFRAMREYNSQRNQHQKLLDGIANLEFLADKKLMDLMGKEIRRLKKNAQQQEAFHILMKISEYERRLHKETATKAFVEGMEEVLNETKTYLGLYQAHQEYAHLMDMVFVWAKKASPQRTSELQKLKQHPKLQKEEDGLGTFAKIYRHQALAMLALIDLQPQIALDHYAQIMLLWESHPHFILEHASTYRRVMGNYLSISAQGNDFSRFPEIIQKVRNSPSQQPAEKIEIFTIVTIAELQWYMATGNWPEMETAIKRAEAGLRAYDETVSLAPWLAIQYNCAIYFLLSNQDKACNRFLQDIINCRSTEQRLDIQRQARILELLLLWKQDEVELLEYRLRSAIRYFSNQGSGQIEEFVISMIQGLIKEGPGETHLLASCAQSLASTRWENVLGAEAISAWLYERASGTPALELLRRQRIN
jgi:hypothetical protein